MNRFEQVEKSSRIKNAAALAGLGALIFIGGKTADHLDGPKESVPAALAEISGSLLFVAGAHKGANVLAGEQVIKMRREEAENNRRIASGLPSRLKYPLRPAHVIDLLRSRPVDQTLDAMTDYWCDSTTLRGTNFAVNHRAPYDGQVEVFHDDIRRVVNEVADARQGIGRNQDKVRVEDEARQLAMFLDETAPLNFDPNEGSTKDNPDSWYSYISAQAGMEMIERLIEYGPTGAPPST